MSPKTRVLRVIILLTLTLLFPILTVRDTQASQTTLETQAFQCLTKVYNLDFNHYNITLHQSYTLPSAPNDPSTYEGVNYFLNSPDSNLTAAFVFQNGELYQFALRTINGPVIQARQFPNLTAEATDLLTRYQTVSSVDLTPLVRLLGMLNQSNSTTATLGNLSLTMSSGPVLPNHIATTFTWRYAPDQACVDLIFDNGVFNTFMDAPRFTAQDSAQTMNTPLENASSTASPAPPLPSSTPPPKDGQNPVTGTDKAVETNYAEYAVIIVLLGIIAVCVGIILNMKRHDR